jgi:hypothetical protein
LQRVVEALGGGAVVFWAALLAQGLQDGLDGGGALGGEVAGDPAGVVHGGVDPDEALVVFLVGVVVEEDPLGSSRSSASWILPVQPAISPAQEPDSSPVAASRD